MVHRKLLVDLHKEVVAVKERNKYYRKSDSKSITESIVFSI